MGEWVMVCHGLATAGVPSPPELEGQLLQSFDVEAHEGRGTAAWTADPRQAMRFDSAIAVIEAWRTQSAVRPLREDGHPNRPLTAFNIEPRLL